MATKTRFQSNGICASFPKATACRVDETLLQFVDPLLTQADGIAQAGKYIGCGETGKTLACAKELVVARAQDAALERDDAFLDAVLCGRDEFGGGGWRGCAQVGNKVRDGVVDLVAYCGDDR